MNQGKNIAAASLATTTLPAIDWKQCVKLANNKQAVAQEILLFIIQHLPADLATIKQAREKANYVELLHCVHKLHGALCYSGMPRLKNAVAHLESYLKQNNPDQAKLLELSTDLETEAHTVLSSPLPC